MRRGLFTKVQPGETVTADVVSRLQDNASAAFDRLSADHDIISSPVVRLATSGVVQAGTAIAVFQGGAGCTVTLPTAANQGANVGSLLVFANRSTVTVTLKPAGSDTVNGFKSYVLGAGAVAILVSDGAAEWFT